MDCFVSASSTVTAVTTNKPLDEAGVYGIQEMGSDFIKEVDGDLENVIGLPTKTLRKILEEFL